MATVNEVWDSFSSLTEDKKNIVIEFISKLSKSTEAKKQRLEIDERRKEIKKGQFWDHKEFWGNV